MNTWLKRTVFLLLAVPAMVLQVSAATPQAITVGRVYSVEGDLLRYVPADEDWVAMVNDTPFGVEETFYSGSQGRAEMFVPNGTWLRVGGSTQIQFIALAPDLSEVDVSSGVARFYNKGSETVIKATSPFGYVMAYPGTAFDFYVGENSVEVVALEGTVSFIHAATEARYDVAADSPSILADARQVASGDGAVDADWHRWNVSREGFWAEKSRLTGRSIKYLPASLRGESYALEENGRWESVPYEGSSRWFWRLTTVARGWSPFTAGRWSDWHGDQVWIPSEPFGYVTHHYGNWIYVRDSWYWAPPVASRRVGLSLLDIGFFWSPGRVSWIHHDNYVGWVPLGPRETYYSHRRWGGAHDTLYSGDIARISINIGSYAYARQAIVVPRDNFYRVDDYRTVRVSNINSTTIINTYNAAPVVNNTVINNYQTDTRRHTLTSRAVEAKPHVSVVRRIETNEDVVRRVKKDDAVAVRKQVRNLKEGHVSRDGGIEAPISTNYFVPASEVNRPKAEIQLQQQKIKTGGKSGRTAEQRKVSPEKPAQKGISPQHAIESPRVQQQKKGPVAPSREVGPEKDVEQPRQGKQPRQAVEQPQEKSQEKATGKKPGKVQQPAREVVEDPKQGKQPQKKVEHPQVQQQKKSPVAPSREVRPEKDVVEQPRQGKQPRQAVEQPQEKPQEKATGKKPRETQPAGNVAEQPKQGKQKDKDTAQPAEQQKGKDPAKNQHEPELTEEELELLRLQQKQEQEKGNAKGKSGKH